MIISPSLLAADSGKYASEIKEVESAGLTYLHIDVMDGHFVPNLSFGPNILEGIRRASKMVFDAHLMIERPSDFAEAFIQAGANIITIHIETNDDIELVYDICRRNNAGFGLSICPDTPLDSLNKFLGIIDILLIMGIQPGFGGQKFIPAVFDRIKKMADIKKAKKYSYLLSVDGGVSENNAAEIAKAGADILVAGSAIFKKTDRKKAIESLRGMKSESWKRAIESFKIEAEAIKITSDIINKDTFGKALDVLAKSVRIATSGCGHSGIACQHFAHSLCCIERPARFIYPSEALHGAMGFVQKDDTMVLASRGGKTAELIPILKICKQKDVKVITITENLDSVLAKKSDIVIAMKIEKESDKFDSQGTSSFVALSAIFDALQVAIIEELGYSNTQFALIHPGGAVGERLSK